MARRKKHEEHVNAEAWAIPYGDLVTLLFALFTVMYAMSSVNEGKFRVLSDSMIAAFNRRSGIREHRSGFRSGVLIPRRRITPGVCQT